LRASAWYFHHRIRPGGGLADPDLGGRVVAVDLGGQRVGVDRAGAGGDRFGGQLLHSHQRVGGLGGPAPRGLPCGGLGGTGQLARGVRATQLVM
jgi:hypothetical protein